MTKGERAAFQISPEYSYAQKGCQVRPPAGMPADASIVIDMQLVNWYSKKAGVKALGDAGVIKRTTRESESWERPRPPFEVSPFLKPWGP